MEITMKSMKSVRGRILLLAAAAVTTMVLLTAVNIYSVESGIQTLSSVYENRVQPLAAIQEIDRDLKDVRFRMAGVLLDQMPAVGSNIQLGEAVNNVPAKWARFKERTSGDAMSKESLELIAKIDNEIPSFVAFSRRLSAVYEKEDMTALRSLLEDEWPAIHAGLLKPVGQLMTQQENGVKSTYEASRKRGRQLLLLGVLAFVVTVVVIGVVSRNTERQITQPLAQLVQVAQDIAEKGDLNQEIHVERDDEVGELSRTFAKMMAYLKEMANVSEAIARGDLVVDVEPRSNSDMLGNAFKNMIQGLRGMVGSVRDASAQVAAGSNQVAEASDQSAKASIHASSAIDDVTNTMHEMSVNVQSVVRNTQSQASSVSETSASIDQMVASIQRVADRAKLLLDISNRSREEVHSGIGAMQKTTDGLSRIMASIGSSATVIGELGSRADDIGKIVDVIDDISEQTNLLALNAAIEAARAGEHGLGFAVVADEVRKLAEKSAQSTNEIGGLVQSIQKGARKAVENMERSTNTVNEGLSFGSELSAALNKISVVVREVNTLAQEIGDATTEQSNGSCQISKATGRLNEITHEISSAVEEQSAGVQTVVKAMERMRELVSSQTSGATELAASSEQMSKMARNLMESMGRFAIEDQMGLPAFPSANQPSAAGARYAATGRA
jgi:methyl-accepting chemotaxis protein